MHFGMEKHFRFKNKDAKLTPWKNGDVIGCYVDLDEHIMSFFVNGVDVGKVPGLDSKGDMQFQGWFVSSAVVRRR